jgi:hypothetical protein
MPLAPRPETHLICAEACYAVMDGRRVEVEVLSEHGAWTFDAQSHILNHVLSPSTANSIMILRAIEIQGLSLTSGRCFDQQAFVLVRCLDPLGTAVIDAKALVYS